MASVQGDSDQIELNIMPMLDIFSILILFLLMSFSTDPLNHDVNPDIALPNSDTLRSLDEIPSLVVTKNQMILNDKITLSIVNHDVLEEERSQGGILKLHKELLKLAEQNKRFSEEKEKPGTLTLEMDKTHPYRLLKRIIISAKQADFVSYKLMVEKNRS